ncbi:MAG: metallophosphoesterase [Selenomonadaceae bacterium]|nr:metallophosphoesterase [Selenomonadaceae bacterium]MDD7055857.1 metallophosphoesterase [Selenomonadaceae bacterium]
MCKPIPSPCCSRRRFLAFCGTALAWLGLGRYLPATAEAGQNSWQFLRQIITHDPATSRTIMWQSHSLPQDTHLEYRLRADAAPQRVDAGYEYLALDGTVTYTFHAAITGLQPGQSCQYRICWEQQAGTWHTLTTPVRDAACHAVLINDSQCADYTVLTRNLRRIMARHADADFLADLGDLTDNGESDWHWRSFFASVGDALVQRPFVPVMGNHECYGLNWQMCLPSRYLAGFALPANGSQRFPGYYYDFNWGPVHFIVLNTQMLELSDLRPGLLTEQLAWLKRVRAQSQLPWQVVLMHKDIIAYGEYQQGTGLTSGISDVGHAFMTAFDALGIDLVLTGHMHTYRNRGHIYQGKHADHGPVYVLYGPSGDQHYEVPANPDFDVVSCPQPTKDNYVTLSATPAQLQLQAWYVDGGHLDTITLQK